MQFITEFLIFFLCFWWFMAIIYKMNLPVKIYNKFPTKFLDKLTDCELCMETHTALLISFCLFLSTGGADYLLFGIMAPSFSNIIKR